MRPSLRNFFIVASILFMFWLLMQASLRGKSLTCDEIAHATAGYTYWKFNDYRIQPENGNLPQRVFGIPLALGEYRFPSLDDAMWQAGDEWGLGNEWFHHLGNSVESMLNRGRAASGLLAVLLGVAIWFWSRKLFGDVGGVLSLLLYVMNPTILANGSLMTSDAAFSLFLLLATGALWSSMHRLDLTRVALSGLALGGLFVSKMSAAVIAPIWVALLLVRISLGRPLMVKLGKPRLVERHSQQAAVLVLAMVSQLLIAAVVIWGFYGFRYSAFSQGQSERSRFHYSWEFVLAKPEIIPVLRELDLDSDQRSRAMRVLEEQHALSGASTIETQRAVSSIRQTILTREQSDRLDRLLSAPTPSRVGRLLEFIRVHQLLPEAFVYGQAHAWRFSRHRGAFWNGQVSMEGWRLYLPYTFLVKTPLPLFVILLLALWAAWLQRRSKEAQVFDRSTAYDSLPLLILAAVYSSATIVGNLSIGHRHIMAIYGPLFILCGSCAYWIKVRRKAATIAICAAVTLMTAETVFRFPNYLSYLNGVVSPGEGYRHLVDSSLDWGQDLPAVKRYLDAHRDAAPAYLSYFGTASPNYYQIPAKPLFSVPGLDHRADLFIVEIPREQKESYLNSMKDYWVAGERSNGQSVGLALLKNPGELRLVGGLYFISATMLQSVCYDPWGPWSESYESTYQKLYNEVRSLLKDDEALRMAVLRNYRAEQLEKILDEFERFRFGRLAAFLRKREPQDNLGGSILVYRLGDDEVDQALNGPPPYPR